MLESAQAHGIFKCATAQPTTTTTHVQAEQAAARDLTALRSVAAAAAAEHERVGDFVSGE
jgi:hypothetical protein